MVSQTSVGSQVKAIAMIGLGSDEKVCVFNNVAQMLVWISCLVTSSSSRKPGLYFAQRAHTCTLHMGPEDPSNREKKYPSFLLMPNFRKLRDDSKYVSLKIGSWKPQKLGPFSSLFLMRKTLSSGQKWFLRPYFPLIRGMFLLRSGLRFSFWALEVPEPRVRKRPLSITNRAFSSLSVRTTFE